MTTTQSTVLSIALGLALVAIASVPAAGTPFAFSNGAPDGRMAMASRPVVGGNEIEAADDFALTGSTTITGATFTGLIPAGALLTSINEVVVEIYRVFPNDSDSTRMPNVPTRVNSPSDTAFDSRDSAIAGQLVFLPSVLNSSFTAANSVLNGINKSPNQRTGGEGSVTGQEVQFTVTFTTPFSNLPADHYFFVPQVLLTSGNFYWLSTPRPNPALNPDLQAWIRNTGLDPDWLRVGTDIVGGSSPSTFNAAFALSGDTTAAVPEPATLLLVGAGVVAFGVLRRGRHPER
jgi:hypothetical protein